MRVLILTQWFQPEPFFKGLSFVDALRAKGHEVEVLTGFPNYPGGKVHQGYRISLFKREVMNGSRVNRVFLYPSHDKSGAKRFLNYASFAIAASLIGPFVVRRPDVIYVYHPPGTIGLPAAVLRFIKRAPVVYDIQDMWPDTISSTGMLSEGRVMRILSKWMKWVYRHCDRINVLSHGFKKLLVARGVAPEKIEVIYNWNDDQALANADVDPNLPNNLGIEGEFVVMFAGTMGNAQALDAVLEAARMAADQVPEARFVFVGGGIDRDRLQGLAQEQGLRNVKFIPAQPMNSMRPILERASVLVVHLKDDPLFEITIPSKIQAYMSVGRPILTAVRGDAAELVHAAKAGIPCEPENPDSIVQAIRTFAQMSPQDLNKMGENGKSYYEEHLKMDVGVDHFCRLFDSLTHS